MNLVPVEYNNQRILTTKQLAEIYETKANNIQQNYKRNLDKFKENIHYYNLNGDNLKLFKRDLEQNRLTESQLVSKNTKNLILWTERGVSRHCKLLDTDKAWEMFDILEDTYFRVKDVVQKQVTTNPLDALKLIVETLENNNQRFDKIENKLNDLENNQLISADQFKELKQAVYKKVHSISEQSHVQQGLYKKLYKSLNKHLNVSTSRAIFAVDYNEAIRFINDWKEGATNDSNN